MVYLVLILKLILLALHWLNPIFKKYTFNDKIKVSFLIYFIKKYFLENNESIKYK